MDKRVKRGTILQVPYEEKDEAKRLGALWDPDIRKWFVPENVSTRPFERWLPDGESAAEKRRALSPRSARAP